MIASKRYRIGDKVIVVTDTVQVPEGWIGYITNNDEGLAFGYCAQTSEGGEEFAFYEHELELLAVGSLNLPPNTSHGAIKAFRETLDKINKPTSDAVNKPKHYAVFEQLEAIEVIASSMTTDQFYGYCLGNILKYRLRAGGKDDVMQELGKADRYQGLFTEFKHLCKDVA